MRLKYVVLTSVNRDDLPDGGAATTPPRFGPSRGAIRHTAVEALTPDFQGVMRDVQTVLDSGVEVFAQNVETVSRLTHPVRDPRAGYEQTLGVLRGAKAYRPAVLTKTSLMLGLGETDAEIRRTMTDLRAAAVDILTWGSTCGPTPNHLAVERFVTPAEFDRVSRVGAGVGISGMRVGPAGAIELSRGTGLEAQQCRPRQRGSATSRRRRQPRDAAHERPPLIRHLGLAPYEPTWRAMQKFTDERRARLPMRSGSSSIRRCLPWD